MSSRLKPETQGRQGGHVIEMQRRRLLLAIGEVIGEEGLEGASVGSVCRRAGVSRRTFYDLFEDREACLLAAFEQAIEWIGSSVAPAYESQDRWNARVRAALAALLELFDAAPGIARLCVVETLRAGPDVSRRRKRVLDVLTAAVDEGRMESKQGSLFSSVGAQGIVGGAVSVVHSRLLEDDHPPLIELLNSLMVMIVQPYLGTAAARRELKRQMPETMHPRLDNEPNPFKGLAIRFTYRTARVIATIAAAPGASNRLVADNSGIGDEGQMSRLLMRLERVGLIENGQEILKGEPNSWGLTQRGEAVHAALGVQSDQ